MDCETIREMHLADEYREGRLSPEEAEAYEQHYFACDRCFEDLLYRDRVAGRLREQGPLIFAEEIRAENRARRATRGSGRLRAARGWKVSPLRVAWAAGALAIAAIVLIAFALGRMLDRSSRLKDFWTPSAYPYMASELRSDVASREFEEAMASYQAGRYGEAAERLERCARATPEDAEILFYLGVSQLLAGDPGEATRKLRRATRLVPSSALYRWYLAQAELLRGRADLAESELLQIEGAGGEFAPQARALLRRIAEVRKNP